MISREQARAIAESAAAAKGLGGGIRHVRLSGELEWARPNVYNGPDLTKCWIAYVNGRPGILGPSTIVLMDREDGKVLYVGGASDEG